VKYEDATSEERKRARRRRAAAARRYKPERVQLLLVAEAPPSELDRYFYFDDVTEHDSLFRYVVRGLLGANPTRSNKAGLLERLKTQGVFLVDIKAEPMDGSPLSHYVAGLVTRIRELAPQRVILIKTSVYDASFRALRDEGLPVIDERIPFPGSGQQRRFEDAFGRAVRLQN
jgi:hypothetical protein